MTLREHLVELRRRLVISALGRRPLHRGLLAVSSGSSPSSRPRSTTTRWPIRDSLICLNFANATAAFSNQVNVSLFVGVIGSSPVWLYQAVGVHRPRADPARRSGSRSPSSRAIVPLFIAGCWFGYLILPKSLEILYGFTPPGASNIQQTTDYFTFVMRFILVFGLAALFPVFLVGLNLIHVLPAHLMLRGWRFAVVLIFVFSAFATPTPDA